MIRLSRDSLESGGLGAPVTRPLAVARRRRRPNRVLWASGCAVIASALLITAAAAAGPERLAGTFIGDSSGYPPNVTLTIKNGVVTAFSAGTVVPCPYAAIPTTGPLNVFLTEPARVNGTTFAFRAIAETEAAKGSVLVTGSLRPAGDIRGTISTTMDDPDQHGLRCAGSEPFDIAPADRPGVPTDTYDFHQLVGHPSFYYRALQITQLDAAIGITCPDGSYYQFVLSSKARGLDPIHVSTSGHFEVSGLAPADGYDYIVDYTVTGQLRLNGSSGGTMTATIVRLDKHETCTAATEHWADTLHRVS